MGGGDCNFLWNFSRSEDGENSKLRDTYQCELELFLRLSAFIPGSHQIFRMTYGHTFLAIQERVSPQSARIRTPHYVECVYTSL